MGAKKNFILDTNVILHDSDCLKNFQENDIYLPIVVFEELDKFKKGNEQLNFNAREFVRELDRLSDKSLFSVGVPLGNGLGRLFVVQNAEPDNVVFKHYPVRKPDHEILAAVDVVSRKHPGMPTILVTKDINLRLKARSLGFETQDYFTDKVNNLDICEDGSRTIEDIDPAMIDEIYSSRQGVEASQVLHDTPVANECFILKSDRNSVICRYNPFSGALEKVSKKTCFGITPRNTEQAFALALLNDPDIKLVALTGKAGTGKTLLALAAALSQSASYKQILLARPVVAMSNKDIGFLPGDAKEKVAPYMQPLFDNLTVIRNQFSPSATELKHIDEMQAGGQLVIEALAFIRGRSLSETYCIIDEAQNLTPNEIKTIVTRAGEGTKMVFTGDIQQIDQPYLDAYSNGLVYMIDRMKGQRLFAHTNLVKGERSELSELASNLL
ncbi:MAG TPA: PhoH family protein [Candidatus Avibacteroides avistercoris]|uniref:PhoH family protein n=1 Tax=Candidatus Avibacteroides avistercoris TaxID=2840690 RepID=A0A9D2UHJ1_9BACT|nr:PhoH family protein [Candidatus Avibacteroides avistercoris]